MILIKRLFFAIYLAAIFSLAGCGGGGGSSSSGGGGDKPESRPDGQITGVAADALVIGGTVAVYAFDDGIKGELLGSTKTNDDGSYSIDINSISRPILLELTGGSYTEEASGKVVTLADRHKLRASIFYESGSPITTMITPWTNVATARAQYEVSTGENIINGITSGFVAFSTIVDVDIRKTIPLNITDPNNVTVEYTEGHKYGFALAQLSQFTFWLSEQNGVEPHTVYTSIELANMMYNDMLADGLLDGKTVSGDNRQVTALNLGSIPLDITLYRHQMAVAQLDIASNTELNKTGLTAQDLYLNLDRYSTTTHPFLGEGEIITIDVDGPEISSVLSEGQVVGGVFDYSVQVTDLLNIKEVRFTINGEFLGVAANPSQPSVKIDTNLYENTEHTITVVATDELDNPNEESFKIIFDNENPIITVSSSSLVNDANYTVQGVVSDSGSQVTNVKINNEDSTLIEDGSWSKQITLAEGSNTLLLSAIDSLGNSGLSEFSVSLDIIFPQHSPIFSTVRVWDENSGNVSTRHMGDLDELEFPFYFEKSFLSLRNVDKTPLALNDTNIPFIGISVSDPSSNGIFTRNEDLSIQQRYSLNGKMLSDWHSLKPYESGRYIVPLTSETLHPEWINAQQDDEHLLEFKITDLAGNDSEYSYIFETHIVLPAALIDARFINAETTAFTYNTSLLGGSVGVCSTDALGDCRLAIASGEQPLMLELRGGSYQEPATDKTQFHTLTRTYLPFSDIDTPVVISPITAIYAGWVEILLSEGKSIEQAMTQASDRFISFFGFNPVSTQIGSLLNATDFTPEIKHALVLQGLSSIAFDAFGDDGSTPTLMRLLYDDMTDDNILDGFAERGGFKTQLGYGNLDLTANTLRHDLAQATLRFIASSENTSLLTANEVFPYLESIANNTDTVFNDAPPLSLDVEGPTLSLDRVALTEEPVYTVTGTYIEDGTGLASITVNGISVDTLTDTAFSHTMTLVEGLNAINVIAIDNAGNPSQETLTIRLDTLPPTLTITPNETRLSGELSVVIDSIDEGGVGSVIARINDTIVLDNDVPSQTLVYDTNLLTDGEHTITVESTDLLGHPSTTSISITVDNTEPTLTMTSPTLVNTAAYTISGEVSDSSGIANVTVNGEDATLSSNSFSLDLNLPTFRSTLQVRVTDNVGNVNIHNYTVNLDTIKPAVRWTYGSTALFSNTNGTSYSDDLAHASATGNALYITSDKLSMAPNEYLTSELDSAGIMYFRAQAVDEDGGTGVGSPADEIQIEYRYLLDNVEQLSWKPAVNQRSVGDTYLFPVTIETFGTNFANVSPNSIVKLELRITDNAGNVAIKSKEFKADIWPATIALNAAVQDPIASNFANRLNLKGVDGLVNQATFTNTSDAPIRIATTSGADSHSFSNNHETAIRQNRGRVKTTTWWRAAKLLSWPGLRQPKQDWGVWEPITKFVNLQGNAEDVNVPAPTYTAYQNYNTNSIPKPANTNWTSMSESVYCPNNFREFTAYTNVYVGNLSTIPAGGGAACNAEIRSILGADPMRFDQKITYDAEIQAGYPKNNTSTSTTTTQAFSNAKIQVFVNDRLANTSSTSNGLNWYSIAPGDTITIKKLVTLPSFTSYNDTEIGNMATFNSYTEKKYDKTLTWTLDRSLTLTYATPHRQRAITVGDAQSFTLTR